MILQVKETESGRMISSKELHEYLKVGRVFASWIRGRIKSHFFEHGKDYREIWIHCDTGEILESKDEASIMVNKGYQKDYFITIDRAKELCTLENSIESRKARDYLLANEENYINLLKAKLCLLDNDKIDSKKLEEWEKLVEMMKEIHPTLFKFKKQMLNMIWQSNKLSNDILEVDNAMPK